MNAPRFVRGAVSRIRQYSNYLRNLWIRRRFANLDLSANVSPKAIIKGASGIRIGPKAVINAYAVIQCNTVWNADFVSETIHIGEHTRIQPFAYLQTDGGRIEIGKHCSVNAYAVLYGHGGLVIGNYVRIATHTVIVPGNHNFDRTDIPIALQGSSGQEIRIDDDVWIGAGVKILGGVQIAKGSIIGAGSVVTKSTEPYGIYAGVPAKLIKSRQRNSA